MKPFFGLPAHLREKIWDMAAPHDLLDARAVFATLGVPRDALLVRTPAMSTITRVVFKDEDEDEAGARRPAVQLKRWRRRRRGGDRWEWEYFRREVADVQRLGDWHLRHLMRAEAVACVVLGKGGHLEEDGVNLELLSWAGGIRRVRHPYSPAGREALAADVRAFMRWPGPPPRDDDGVPLRRGDIRLWFV